MHVPDRILVSGTGLPLDEGDLKIQGGFLFHLLVSAEY